MSDPIDPVAVAAQTPDNKDNATNQKVGPDADPSKIFVKDMTELKEKAPEVLKAMEEGIMTRIIGSMRHHNEEMKRLIREGQQKAG